MHSRWKILFNCLKFRHCEFLFKNLDFLGFQSFWYRINTCRITTDRHHHDIHNYWTAITMIMKWYWGFEGVRGYIHSRGSGGLGPRYEGLYNWEGEWGGSGQSPPPLKFLLTLSTGNLHRHCNGNFNDRFEIRRYEFQILYKNSHGK